MSVGNIYGIMKARPQYTELYMYCSQEVIKLLIVSAKKLLSNVNCGCCITGEHMCVCMFVCVSAE